MKVIHTIASLAPQGGGPSRSVPELCDELKSQGVDVEIVTSVHPSDDVANIPICWSRIKYFNFFTFQALLLKRTKILKPDLIHDHGIWLPMNHIATRWARKRGVPYLISPRGMLEPWAMKYKPWKKKIAWVSYQKRDLEGASVIHATSLAEYNSIRSLGLYNPVALIPNGVKIPEEFPATEGGKNTYHRTVLFLSRIHPIKGVINLVEAWAQTRPAGWRVIIAGPEEENYRAEVDNMIRKYKLESVFNFVGPVSERDKWDYFRKADLFVLPSFSENFGIVVAEALACGVPVITTRGTPWEELTVFRCGWWIEAEPDSLAKALIEATSKSDNERREMGKRGRGLVERRYSWSRIANEIREVYGWIVEGGEIPTTIMLN